MVLNRLRPRWNWFASLERGEFGICTQGCESCIVLFTWQWQCCSWKKRRYAHPDSINKWNQWKRPPGEAHRRPDSMKICGLQFSMLKGVRRFPGSQEPPVFWVHKSIWVCAIASRSADYNCNFVVVSGFSEASRTQKLEFQAFSRFCINRVLTVY